MICLKILDKNQNIVATEAGDQEATLIVSREYEEGDKIVVEITEKPCHVWIQMDDAIGKSLVYVKENIVYEIPFGNRKINLSPKAFFGKCHLICVRRAYDFETACYRNLALNVNDQHGNTMFYPHASANVETRGEVIFAAMNTIDGVTANHGHGEWPFTSWGINQNPNAKMKVDFGRIVEVDRLILYLRADFPHDNWWEKCIVKFSNGEERTLSFQKTDKAQEFMIGKMQISWLEISHLLASAEPSPFPALTQIEVYGIEVREEDEKNETNS